MAQAHSHCSFPEDIQVAVPNLGGRAVFLPAFVVPLPPPEKFHESEHAMLRLVSMVPYIEDWVAFEGGCNLPTPYPLLFCPSHHPLTLCLHVARLTTTCTRPLTACIRPCDCMCVCIITMYGMCVPPHCMYTPLCQV